MPALGLAGKGLNLQTRSTDEESYVEHDLLKSPSHDWICMFLSDLYKYIFYPRLFLFYVCCLPKGSAEFRSFFIVQNGPGDLSGSTFDKL